MPILGLLLTFSRNTLLVKSYGLNQKIRRIKNDTILIYCYHGNSSKSAANFFVQHGFEKVLSMDEGYVGWIKS